MEEFLVIALVVSFLYAAALVLTLAKDILTGRYKRLKRLRDDMSLAQTNLENIRNRREKLWESLSRE